MHEVGFVSPVGENDHQQRTNSQEFSSAMQAAQPDRISTGPVYALGLAAVILALLATWLATTIYNNDDQHRLDAVSRDLLKGLTDRIAGYERGLQGTRGMINAVGVQNLNLEVFDRYASARNIPIEFPGSRGIGFIELVEPRDLEGFLLRERQKGRPDFAIRQLSPNDGPRMVIRLISPEATNKSAVGLDIASERQRREAALAAGASGQATLSGPITLVQASGIGQHGMLFLLPCYRTGPIPQSHQEREANLIGWTYMPLSIDDVLVNLSAPTRLLSFSIVDLETNTEIYKPTDAAETLPLEDKLSWQQELSIFGRRWLITTTPSSAFFAEQNRVSPRWILAAGVVTSLIVAYLFHLLRQNSFRRRILTAATEKAKKDGMLRWQLLANSLPNLISTFNAKGECDFLSNQWTLYTGLPETNQLGNAWLEKIHPDDRDNLALAWRKATSSLKDVEFEFRIRRHDGSYRWFFARAVPILENGKITRWYVSSTDIEDRKLAELRVQALLDTREEEVEARTEELRQAEADLKNIVNAIPSMIGYWNKDLTNRFANRAYKVWFGVEGADIAGKHIKDLLGDVVYEKNLPFMREALAGNPQKFERELTKPDGTKSYVQAHYLPDFRGGEVAGFYVLVFDVTDMKNSQIAMAAAKSLAEETTRAKSLFLTSMSHELRTPMNGVLGFADLLSSEAFGPLTAKQREFCHAIKSSGTHLLNLMNDILELSIVEAGQVMLSVEPIDPATVILSAASTLQAQATKAGIQLTNLAKSRKLPLIDADKTRLLQALINLGTNAIKYNRPGGQVSLDAEVIDGGYLRISVIDNGLGIDEVRQHEIFQPFNRLGAEQSKIEGTGIGLTLTKKLVEMMDGRIDFSSSIGHGTTFWIDLPLHSSKGPRSDIAVAPDDKIDIPHISRNMRVLYVEDNEQNILLMTNYLSLLPSVELLTAKDGINGIQVAIAQLPDLIILDINLPGKNGYDILRELRAHPALVNTPIVALTANAMSDSTAHGLSAGFDAYLTKPARMNDIMSLISTYATMTSA